jgi:acyl carrier protein
MNIIIDKINSILVRLLVIENVDGFTEQTDFINDYMADSLILISIIVEIESAFSIEIPDDDLISENMRNYMWLCAEVERLINEQQKSNKDSEGCN